MMVAFILEYPFSKYSGCYPSSSSTGNLIDNNCIKG
ncbi:unnamed protein product [Brugia timori]|uniref:Uncharacterized protein n=1 Tax=Brugia timori TaxID=42155 RepID=A0A0R3R3J0_9BILA|nr:unnamed protein product [Brugia timori]